VNNTYAPRKGMTDAEIAQTIEAIITEATLDEKVGMMSGKGFFADFKADGGRWGGRPYRAGGGIERLDVPAFYFTDGPRGVARGNSTCFPCSMARGATFDPDLEKRIGEIIGIEARAQGCTLSGAVCFNLLRHPAWGRAQETYGEDPHHLGEMGAALALGIQTHNVVATIKHFAVNSMENARFYVDVEIDERSLHEVYLPHFKRAIDAGCASVMSAYNKLNGAYCGQNRHLLTDILRGEWGFEGFVHSDWVMGVYETYGAVAGLDIENPEPRVFGRNLIDDVESGKIDPQVINQACRRILKIMYQFACAADPLPDYNISMVAQPAHVAVALEAAEKSAVLLKNNGILPLAIEKMTKLAVLGRLAALENTGDNGSSRVRPPYVITPLQGLQKYLGADKIITGDETDLDAAHSAALASDAILIIAGYTAEHEGEYIPGDIALGADVPEDQRDNAKAITFGGDRDSLNLPADQLELIARAQSTGKPVIVVLIAGSAVMVEDWHNNAAAILQTFYSGMEGGTALAKLLFGDISPSGKLPFSVARNAADYPYFDKNASRITYDGYHGYTLLERDKKLARYAFGHGLSYAQFAYDTLTAHVSEQSIEAQISITNNSKITADAITQFYVSFPGIATTRPQKLLKAFQRVTLKPNETRIISAHIAKNDLRWRNPETHDWELESGTYQIHAGSSSQGEDLQSTSVTF
jgi:beta-glucosidase